MAQPVVSGAMLMCSFGLAPSTLTVTPERMVGASNLPAATIMDNIPFKNIAPFGLCTTMTNPAVAGATAAKLGVFTPSACVPVTPAPWTPGLPTVQVGNLPILTNTCTLMCQWGGLITISNPGQVTLMTT